MGPAARLLLVLLAAACFCVAPAAAEEDESPPPHPKHKSADPLKCKVCRAAYDKAMERVSKHVRRSSFPVKMICGFTLLADGKHGKELEHCIDTAIRWQTHGAYRPRSHPGNWYPALAGVFLAEVMKHRPERRIRDAMRGIIAYFAEVQEKTGGWWKWHEGAYKERLDYPVVDHGFISVLVMAFFRVARAQGIAVPEEMLERGEACITRITNDRGVGYGTPRKGGRSGGDKTGGRGAFLLSALAYAGDLDHRIVPIYRKVLPARLPNLDKGHHVGALHGLAVTLGCHLLGPKVYRRLTEMWRDRLIRKQEPDGGLYIGDDGDAGGEPKLLKGNVGSTAAFALMILLQDPVRLVPPNRRRDRRTGELTVDISRAVSKKREREQAEAQKRAAEQARQREQADREAREKAVAEAEPTWNPRLLAMLRVALSDGRKIRFRSRSLKKRATLTGIDERGRLKLTARGIGIVRPLGRLKLEERAEIALAAAREDRPAEQAVAAFFALAAGKRKEGKACLERAGDEGLEVEAFFLQYGDLD